MNSEIILCPWITKQRKNLNDKIVVSIDWYFTDLDGICIDWRFRFSKVVNWKSDSKRGFSAETLQLAKETADKILIGQGFKLLSESEYKKLLIMI